MQLSEAQNLTITTQEHTNFRKLGRKCIESRAQNEQLSKPKLSKATIEGPGRQRQRHRESPIPLPRTVIRKNFLPHGRISLIWSQGKKKKATQRRRRARATTARWKHTQNSKPQLFWRRSLRNQSEKKGEKSQKRGNFLVQITGASREKPLST